MKVSHLDHLKAFRKQGLASGYVLDFFRYPFKLIEVVKARLFYQKKLTDAGGISK